MSIQSEAASTAMDSITPIPTALRPATPPPLSLLSPKTCVYLKGRKIQDAVCFIVVH